MHRTVREAALLIAARGSVDARTAERWLLGKSGKNLASERCERAARELGIIPVQLPRSRTITLLRQR